MRVSFPEHTKWQNAMRPEDNATRDAELGIPRIDDTSCGFVEELRNHLRSLFGVTKNYFADEERRLWPIYEVSIVRYRKCREDYERRRAKLGRGLEIPVARRTAVLLILVLALVAAIGAGAWLMQRNLEWWAAWSLSLVCTCLAVGVGYLVGLAVRQAPKSWMKALAVAVGMAIVILTGWLAHRLIANDTAEAAGIAVGLFAILSAVGALAFLSHDADFVYEALSKALDKSQWELKQVVSMRRENREYHLNCARRHVELAGEMLSTYCTVNRRLRKNGAFPAWPAAVTMEAITDADFQLFGENTPE